MDEYMRKHKKSVQRMRKELSHSLAREAREVAKIYGGDEGLLKVGSSYLLVQNTEALSHKNRTAASAKDLRPCSRGATPVIGGNHSGKNLVVRDKRLISRGNKSLVFKTPNLCNNRASRHSAYFYDMFDPIFLGGDGPQNEENEEKRGRLIYSQVFAKVFITPEQLVQMEWDISEDVNRLFEGNSQSIIHGLTNASINIGTGINYTSLLESKPFKSNNPKRSPWSQQSTILETVCENILHKVNMSDLHQYSLSLTFGKLEQNYIIDLLSNSKDSIQLSPSPQLSKKHKKYKKRLQKDVDFVDLNLVGGKKKGKSPIKYNSHKDQESDEEYNMKLPFEYLEEHYISSMETLNLLLQKGIQTYIENYMFQSERHQTIRKNLPACFMFTFHLHKRATHETRNFKRISDLTIIDLFYEKEDMLLLTYGCKLNEHLLTGIIKKCGFLAKLVPITRERETSYITQLQHNEKEMRRVLKIINYLNAMNTMGITKTLKSPDSMLTTGSKKSPEERNNVFGNGNIGNNGNNMYNNIKTNPYLIMDNWTSSPPPLSHINNYSSKSRDRLIEEGSTEKLPAPVKVTGGTIRRGVRSKSVGKVISKNLCNPSVSRGGSRTRTTSRVKNIESKYFGDIAPALGVTRKTRERRGGTYIYTGGNKVSRGGIHPNKYMRVQHESNRDPDRIVDTMGIRKSASITKAEGDEVGVGVGVHIPDLNIPGVNIYNNSNSKSNKYNRGKIWSGGMTWADYKRKMNLGTFGHTRERYQGVPSISKGSKVTKITHSTHTINTQPNSSNKDLDLNNQSIDIGLSQVPHNYKKGSDPHNYKKGSDPDNYKKGSDPDNYKQKSSGPSNTSFARYNLNIQKAMLNRRKHDFESENSEFSYPQEYSKHSQMSSEISGLSTVPHKSIVKCKNISLDSTSKLPDNTNTNINTNTSKIMRDIYRVHHLSPKNFDGLIPLGHNTNKYQSIS